MSITLNNAMGGITSPFLDTYVYTDDGGTEHTLEYGASNAGGSFGFGSQEGWTVGGDGWVSGEAEVFYDGYYWMIYDPSLGDWAYYDSFVNGTDGTEGINFSGGWMLTSATIYPAGPDAPTGLSATDGTVADQVDLTWDSASGVTWRVYRHTSDDFSGASQIASGLSSPSYSDTTVTDWTRYYYWVTAYDGSDESDASAVDDGWADSSAASDAILTPSDGSGWWTGETDYPPGDLDLTGWTALTAAELVDADSDDETNLTKGSGVAGEYSHIRFDLPFTGDLKHLKVAIRDAMGGGIPEWVKIYLWSTVGSWWDLAATERWAPSGTITVEDWTPSPYDDNGVIHVLLVGPPAPETVGTFESDGEGFSGGNWRGRTTSYPHSGSYSGQMHTYEGNDGDGATTQDADFAHSKDGTAFRFWARVPAWPYQSVVHAFLAFGVSSTYQDGQIGFGISAYYNDVSSAKLNIYDFDLAGDDPVVIDDYGTNVEWGGEYIQIAGQLFVDGTARVWLGETPSVFLEIDDAPVADSAASKVSIGAWIPGSGTQETDVFFDDIEKG